MGRVGCEVVRGLKTIEKGNLIFRFPFFIYKN